MKKTYKSTSKKTIYSDELGEIVAGKPFEATDAQVAAFRQHLEETKPTAKGKK